MKRSLFALTAGLALVSTVSAQAAAPAPCINSAEMHGLIAYFLPEVIGEVSKNCSAHLPAGSYVRAGLPRIGARLADRKDAFWPSAKTAFLKMSGGDKDKDAKAMAGLPDEALRPLVDVAMASKIAIPVNPSTCADVNDVTEALAPLSTEQTVHLLATIFTIVARKDNKMRSCPRGAK